MVQFVKKYALLFIVLASVIGFAACASIASPTGGEPEFDPPKVVKSKPGFNQLNVTSQKVVIEFDENVVVNKPSEKVIITPPQRSLPIITSANRKVIVHLRDFLLPNTTYTIDFTDAIADNNEGTPLENFSISFSTGDHVDSLAVSGKILDASNLEPVKGMYVGLHSNLNDTAFTKEKFLRISRTNDQGFFTIRGIAPGTYKIYGLDDANRDYMYDSPSEAIAFLDSTIVPSFEKAYRNDTIFNKKDTTKIDTIRKVEHTHFLPKNIVLRSFKSSFQRQYLQKYERLQNKLLLYFGAPTTMPQIEPLNFDKNKDWYILEKSVNNDTLSFWIKDVSIAAMDTLAFKITYPKTDSLNQSVPFTDTLSFVDRTRKKIIKEKKDKKKKEDEEEKIQLLEMKNNVSSVWDIYKNITIEFAEPLLESPLDKISLQHLVDSTYSDISFDFQADSLNPRLYTIKHKWKYGNEYKIAIDSASIYSVYGLWNNALNQKFKVKDENQYAQFAIKVHGIDTIPAFIELLDKSDKPIRKSRVKDHVAIFKNVDPGQYYVRIILDTNNNGVWDTGDYEKKRQPEMVCYNPKLFELKAYFEIEEDWTVDVTTLTSQKPLEITKNKPVENEARKKKIEQQEQKKQQKQRDFNNVNDPSNTSGMNGNYRNNSSY